MLTLKKTTFTAWFVILMVFLVPLLLWAYSSNPPLSRTGAPGESTCASCHSGGLGGGGRDERKKIRDPMKCLRWRAASFLLYVCGVLEEPVHQLLCIKHHQEKTRAEMRGRRKSSGG